MNQTTRLETAAQNLAQAALEFEEACTATYRYYYDNHKKYGDRRPIGNSQLALQETVQDITRLGTYSTCQARAINACFSAWRPPQASPVRSFPIGGGAA